LRLRGDDDDDDSAAAAAAVDIFGFVTPIFFLFVLRGKKSVISDCFVQAWPGKQDAHNQPLHLEHQNAWSPHTDI
jgi:hypothetical protein